jgi:hypothetical protein
MLNLIPNLPLVLEITLTVMASPLRLYYMNYEEQTPKACISSVREENTMNARSNGHVCFSSRLISETIQWNFDYILLALN